MTLMPREINNFVAYYPRYHETLPAGLKVKCAERPACVMIGGLTGYKIGKYGENHA
jgi:hypothetical protein